MKLDFAKVRPKTKWEDGFPHLYGHFGAHEVVSVQKYDRAEGTKWTNVMRHSSWLE